MAGDDEYSGNGWRNQTMMDDDGEVYVSDGDSRGQTTMGLDDYDTASRRQAMVVDEKNGCDDKHGSP